MSMYDLSGTYMCVCMSVCLSFSYSLVCCFPGPCPWLGGGAVCQQRWTDREWEEEGGGKLDNQTGDYTHLEP